MCMYTGLGTASIVFAQKSLPVKPVLSVDIYEWHCGATWILVDMQATLWKYILRSEMWV